MIFTLVELKSPEEVLSFLIENEIRLWVAYMVEPTYEAEMWYNANTIMYVDGVRSHVGVYSFYVTRPFRNTQEDIEKLLALVFSFIPVVTFEEVYVKEFVRIPSGNPKPHTRRKGSDRSRRTIKIFDVDNAIMYVFDRKTYVKALRSLSKEELEELLRMYPDTLTPPTTPFEVPKWIREL